MKLTAIILSQNTVLTRILTNLSSKGLSINILGTVSSKNECLDAVNQDLPDIVFVDVDFFASEPLESCKEMTYLPLIVSIVNTNSQCVEAYRQYLYPTKIKQIKNKAQRNTTTPLKQNR